jgi:hypothetical protein
VIFGAASEHCGESRKPALFRSHAMLVSNGVSRRLNESCLENRKVMR